MSRVIAVLCSSVLIVTASATESDSVPTADETDHVAPAPASASPSGSQPGSRRAASTRAAQNGHVEWWDRAKEGTVGRYWIKSDLSDERTRELGQVLNQMHGHFVHVLGSLQIRGEEHFNVFMFDRREDYLYTLQSRFGISGLGSAGMFFVRPEGGALAFWVGDTPWPRVLHTVKHEGFHQFAYSRFAGDLPVWVNEGLAEFFGESVLVGRTLVMGQSNVRVLEDIRQDIEEGRIISFREMLTMSSQQWLDSVQRMSARTQYNQAWSMVHFLIYGDNARYQKAFERYLALMNRGHTSEQAFVQAFQTNDIEAFERRWREYAMAAKPSAFVTAMERAEFLSAGLLELSQREIYPETIEELQEALREIEFAYTLQAQHVSVTLKADDPSLFTIPKDDLSRQQPVFELVKMNPSRIPRRERELEEKNPTPPLVRTRHLRPHEIGVRWQRDRRDNTFMYEIIAH